MSVFLTAVPQKLNQPKNIAWRAKQSPNWPIKSYILGPYNDILCNPISKGRSRVRKDGSKEDQNQAGLLQIALFGIPSFSLKGLSCLCSALPALLSNIPPSWSVLLPVCSFWKMPQGPVLSQHLWGHCSLASASLTVFLKGHLSLSHWPSSSPMRKNHNSSASVLSAKLIMCWNHCQVWLLPWDGPLDHTYKSSVCFLETRTLVMALLWRHHFHLCRADQEI